MNASLDAQAEQVQSLISPGIIELRSPKVSAWSVGQHLDHILKSGSAVIQQLLGPATNPGGRINIIGRAVLLIGRIPRGRGKSPEAFIGEELSTSDLANKFSAYKSLLAKLKEHEDLPKSTIPFSKHPYFGTLSPKQWIKFLYIHNNHHLRIIADIQARR